jgi:hypothetical protein
VTVAGRVSRAWAATLSTRASPIVREASKRGASCKPSSAFAESALAICRLSASSHSTVRPPSMSLHCLNMPIRFGIVKSMPAPSCADAGTLSAALVPIPSSSAFGRPFVPCEPLPSDSTYKNSRRLNLLNEFLAQRPIKAAGISSLPLQQRPCKRDLSLQP